MIRKVVYLLIAALLTSGLAAPALSQNVSDEIERERLACLTDDAALLPKLPPLSVDDRRRARLRLQLEFTRPEAAPNVKILRASGEAALQERILRYVESYRLPCLRNNDRRILAIQEFDVAAQRGPMLIVPTTRTLPPCFEHPKVGPHLPDWIFERDSNLRKSVIRLSIRFVGDGSQAPVVTVLASNASPSLLRIVENYVKEHYRMPCRTADDPDVVAEQVFAIDLSTNQSQFGWSRKVVPLGEFLGMVEGLERYDAFFDLNAMDCPFDLWFTLWQPLEKSNRIYDVEMKADEFNADRQLLVQWLKALPLKLGKPAVADQLLGTGFKISVPCGILDLSSSKTS
jgi:hypothetical protein